jgi:hypothetical protein
MKFVVWLFVDEETKGSNPVCKWTKPTCPSMNTNYIGEFKIETINIKVGVNNQNHKLN